MENEVPAAVASGGQDVVLSRAGLGAEIPTTLQIVLDGTGSSDPNGDPLTYAWTVLDAPDRAPGDGDATALVSFDSRVSAKPVITFSPALRAGTGSPLAAAGWYRFRLSVSDAGLTTSETLELRAVDPLNLLPVADAGLDRYVEVTPRSGGGIEASVPDPLAPAANSLRPFVRLDGRESADPAERAITYAWAVATRPAGSSLADVSGATSAFPTFVPDKLGLYIFQLVVNNGLYRSRPDYVNIRVTRRPPTADAFAIDRTTSQRSSVFDPVLRVPLGRRIALDGSRSLAASPADQGTLAFVWRQTGGPRVTLEPTALRSIVTFSPVEPGRVTFRLDVSDRYGSSDSTELAVDVLPEPTASVRVPELRIVSRAETSSSVGQDFGEGVALNLISLRVQTPTRVFLTGTLTSLAKAGERFDYVWKQLQGPPVLLTNSGEVLTSARESRTSFRPSTSRVHVFELRVFPLDPRGRRTALFASRFIRIVVDTPTARVPEARAVAGSLRLPTEGSLSRRTIELDATRAVGPAPGSGSKLSYTWRQISGPRGSIDAPFAVRTTFTAPEVAGETGTRLYVIELTVDSTPPGDRSEPVYLQLTQEPATPVTTGTSQPANVSFGGGGGGSGCALAPAGTSDAGACVPLFALSTMFFRNRRRRLWQRCSSVSGSGPATGSSSKPAR
ncbi:MAG: hypothetical protein HY303_14935 [Candidatus Wallbacteria bacterium]|nr:hypothetical protein [Candidatus Wallbacteria bacterium]